MFEGIKSLIRETRIKFDFPRYEGEQTMACRSEAERRFDGGQLQKEVTQIKTQAALAGDQRFGNGIIQIRRKIALLERDVLHNLGQLAIFERDYKSELHDLYGQKQKLLQTRDDLLTDSRRLRDDRSLAHQELDEAFEDLEVAKNNVGRWHSKSARSPLLFGNGGNKIPRHSIFGQSFGDLNAAKGRRGDAVDEIDDCKRRLTDIKVGQSANRAQLDRIHDEIGRVILEIAGVKAARQRMFDLKNDGVQPGVLRKTLCQVQSSKKSFEEELVNLENRRRALVEETDSRMGVRERESAIAELLAKKTQFISDFGSDQRKRARQDHHRHLWMKKHGPGGSK